MEIDRKFALAAAYQTSELRLEAFKEAGQFARTNNQVEYGMKIDCYGCVEPTV